MNSRNRKRNGRLFGYTIILIALIVIIIVVANTFFNDNDSKENKGLFTPKETNYTITEKINLKDSIAAEIEKYLSTAEDYKADDAGLKYALSDCCVLVTTVYDSNGAVLSKEIDASSVEACKEKAYEVFAGEFDRAFKEDLAKDLKSAYPDEKMAKLYEYALGMSLNDYLKSLDIEIIPKEEAILNMVTQIFTKGDAK